jgi:DNA replication initiation complex subunit (GINS family)
LNAYEELYVAWRREIEHAELGSLPRDFYVRITDYLRLLREGGRMLDKKTLKSSLLEHESEHVQNMLEQLVWARHEKLIRLVAESQKVPSELLAEEEARLFEGFAPFAEAYSRFAKGLLQGQLAVEKVEKAHKRVVLRFVKSVPAIIGVDMKAYGPFLAEDVASVSVENARILVKQGLAILVGSS